jgi:KDO2-lipid IV(A) lauroyltransferase
MADMTYFKRRWRLRGKRAGDAIVGALALGLIKAFRLVDPDKMADFAGWAARTFGPYFKEHRIGRENLVAAFPEKSAAEIDKILHGAWDNLGRMGAEFTHLDKLVDFDPKNPTKHGRIEVPRATIERFDYLAADGRPALFFAAHLANWELPAVCAARYKMDSAVLYRRPNIASIDRWLRETRDANMGKLISTGMTAPMQITQALTAGAHVGMLVDQYYVRGVEVTFFGRRTMANPLLARLAQHFDCPIHGSRIVRLPGHRFRAELSEEIAPVRDADGKIDIAGTTQAIITVIEGWIREHPEQWLWQHRRWRPEDMEPEKSV